MGVVIGVPLLTLALEGVLTELGDLAGGVVMLALIGLTALLSWYTLPHGYELWPGRLRVILGRPFVLNVPFNAVSEIRRARGIDAVNS